MLKNINYRELPHDDSKPLSEVTSSFNALSEKDLKNLLAQIQDEFKVAQDHLKPKRDEWLARLKLFNNQKRDKSAIGNPLLFTIHNTVLASLYVDQVASVFQPRARGDEAIAENLTDLFEYDYEEMGKNVVDYFAIWDTLFYSNSVVMFNGFDAKTNTPIISNVDYQNFYKDPDAVSINPRSNGSLGARFFGRELLLPYDFVKNHKKYFNVDLLKKTDRDLQREIELVRQQRFEALNLVDTDDYTNITHKDNSNKLYQVVEWNTHFNGKKCTVTVTNDFKNIIRYDVSKQDHWNYVDRPLFPITGMWDNVSIPDLIEDKQRGSSVIQNLMVKNLKAEVYGMYAYDQNMIENENDLTFGFNKVIPVKGNPGSAIAPIRKSSPNVAYADYILNFLDASAQRATATPEQQQGVVGDTSRTLGELNMVTSNVGVRYGLTASVFGWSEKAFANLWYLMYKSSFKSGMKEKFMRLNGAFGTQFRDLTRENLVAKVDPDVKVTSKIQAEQEKATRLQKYTVFYNALMQDPQANRRYANKKLGELIGLKQDEIDRLMPPSVDELGAEEQNEWLNQNKMVKVDPNENHVVHMEIHQKANPTKATLAHIKTHRQMLKLAQENPELAGAGQQSVATGRGMEPGQMGIGGDPLSQLFGGQLTANNPVSATNLNRPSLDTGAL